MKDFIAAANGPKPVDGALKLVLFICSIVLPGLTQIGYAIYLGCDVPYVLAGLAILLLSPFLVGFVWSIVWGVFALKGGHKAGDAPAAAV